MLLAVSAEFGERCRAGNGIRRVIVAAVGMRDWCPGQPRWCDAQALRFALEGDHCAAGRCGHCSKAGADRGTIHSWFGQVYAMPCLRRARAETRRRIGRRSHGSTRPSRRRAALGLVGLINRAIAVSRSRMASIRGRVPAVWGQPQHSAGPVTGADRARAKVRRALGSSGEMKSPRSELGCAHTETRSMSASRPNCHVAPKCRDRPMCGHRTPHHPACFYCLPKVRPQRASCVAQRLTVRSVK